MRSIWKYTLKVADNQSLVMPKESEILSCQTQNDVITLWVLVYPLNGTCERHFVIAGTGHPIDFNNQSLQYINTVQMTNGSLIWHVFEQFK